eukprot:s10_g12.t1
MVLPHVSLPIATTSGAVFRRWALKAWSEDLLMHHSDRKKLRMLRLNAIDTRQVVNTFGDSEQLHLAQELSLSFQTEEQKMKWASDANGLCRYCNQTDSRHHRIFSCAASTEVRNKYHDVLTFLEDNGSELHELPFLLQHENLDMLDALHHCQPDAVVEEQMKTSLASLVNLGHTPNFFTDGSLRFPHSELARHGAYAVVLDTCISDDERILAARRWRQTGTIPATLMFFTGARIQGQQSIYRAELSAVVIVCENTTKACIHTDNAAVVSTFGVCLEAHTLTDIGEREELDLVHRLWRALQKGSFVIRKIKAHQQVTLEHSDLEVYAILGNMLADVYANKTAQYMQPDLVRLADKMYADIQVEKDHLRRYFQYLLELRKHYAILLANEREDQVHRELQPSTADTPLQRLTAWTVEDVWQVPDPGVCFFQFSPWGVKFCRTVLQWMQQVQWPNTDKVDDQDVGISWIELLMSFVYSTATLPPIKRHLPTGEGVLQVLDQWSDLELYQIGLGEQANNFSNIINQVQKLVTVPQWPERSKGFTRSLYILGSRNQAYGFCQRPVIPQQAAVIKYMYEYQLANDSYAKFVPVQGLSLQRIDQSQLTRGWDKGLKMVVKGYTKTRSLRQNPQQRLRF